MHVDVPDREREFLKTLVHFQTLGLQIFEMKQSHISKLEEQLKGQEELNRALETSLANEAALQQQVQELEKQLHQTQQEHQREKEEKEAELQKIRSMNEELIRDKDMIM